MLPPSPERLARLAPTPSGYLHAGNAANFLANQLLAGPEGGLLLRIDDLDQGRYRRPYVEDVFRTLEWLGIEPTEGPSGVEDFERNWSQWKRLPLYGAALERLRDHPLLFACRCSRRELKGGRHRHHCRLGRVDFAEENVTWRVNTRKLPRQLGGFRYLATNRHRRYDLHAEMPDFAVRLRNGMPSYQLACTVDDHHFGVNVCARGLDLLPSTAAQRLLSDLLGYPPLFDRVLFLHHPLLEAKPGEKLAKSSGAAGVRDVENSGFTPGQLREIAARWTALLRR